jgi:hypothetical protein
VNSTLKKKLIRMKLVHFIKLRKQSNSPREVNVQIESPKFMTNLLFLFK